MEKIYIKEANGNGKTRKVEAALISCDGCGNEFLKATRKIAKKNYCNRTCYQKANQNRIAVKCSWCENELYKTPSDLKKSRSGLYFCNRACKENAQMIAGGLKAIMPAHYGKGMCDYRQLAFRSFPVKCVDCEIEFKPILCVHHKDGNRNNNNLDNLEIVCGNHHLLRHMTRSDQGDWRFLSSALTPRSELGDLDKMLYN